MIEYEDGFWHKYEYISTPDGIQYYVSAAELRFPMLDNNRYELQVFPAKDNQVIDWAGVYIETFMNREVADRAWDAIADEIRSGVFVPEEFDE